MSMLIFSPFILLIIIGLIWAGIQEEKRLQNSMNPVVAKSSVIKSVYFYLVSIIALFMIVYAVADVVNIGLRTWIFPKADLNEYPQPNCAVQIPRAPDMKPEDYKAQLDNCQQNQISENERRSIIKQKDAVRDLSLLIISIPLFTYHWKTIRKESKEEREEAKKTA